MSNGSSDEEVAIDEDEVYGDDDCGNDGDDCVDPEGLGLVGVDVKSCADDGVCTCGTGGKFRCTKICW